MWSQSKSISVKSRPTSSPASSSSVTYGGLVLLEELHHLEVLADAQVVHVPPDELAPGLEGQRLKKPVDLVGCGAVLKPRRTKHRFVLRAHGDACGIREATGEEDIHGLAVLDAEFA